jgi:hypothetical protein
MILYYDRQGRPISLEGWALLLRDLDYRRVGLDEVGGFVISTVWLGLNHQWLASQPPIIFETMVFSAEDEKPVEEYMDRYSTEEEARLGHLNVVSVVREMESICVEDAE